MDRLLTDARLLAAFVCDYCSHHFDGFVEAWACGRCYNPWYLLPLSAVAFIAACNYIDIFSNNVDAYEHKPDMCGGAVYAVLTGIHPTMLIRGLLMFTGAPLDVVVAS